MFVEIITPEQTVISEPDVDFVIARTLEKDDELGGELGIYPSHAPMIVRIPMGTIRYEKNNKISFFVVASAFLEVKDNKVVIVALAAKKVEKIDMETAKTAKAQAEKWLDELAGRAAFDSKAAEAEVKKAMVSLYKTSSKQ